MSKREKEADIIIAIFSIEEVHLSTTIGDDSKYRLSGISILWLDERQVRIAGRKVP